MSTVPLGTSSGESAGRRVILVVEDNEDNRLIYSLALGHAGYAVLEAVTGLDGVERARTLLPDLILMDVSLPGIDGWEATRRLKADPTTRDIPVIAVTAHAMATDRDRAIAAGCDGYLAKPVAPQVVVGTVARYLAERGERGERAGA